jgi:hypothetical protein
MPLFNRSSVAELENKYWKYTIQFPIFHVNVDLRQAMLKNFLFSNHVPAISAMMERNEITGLCMPNVMVITAFIKEKHRTVWLKDEMNNYFGDGLYNRNRMNHLKYKQVAQNVVEEALKSWRDEDDTDREERTWCTSVWLDALLFRRLCAWDDSVFCNYYKEMEDRAFQIQGPGMMRGHSALVKKVNKKLNEVNRIRQQEFMERITLEDPFNARRIEELKSKAARISDLEQRIETLEIRNDNLERENLRLVRVKREYDLAGMVTQNEEEEDSKPAAKKIKKEPIDYDAETHDV